MIRIGYFRHIKVTRLVVVLVVLLIVVIVAFILLIELVIQSDDFLEILLAFLVRGRNANANLFADAAFGRALTPLAVFAERALFLRLMEKQKFSLERIQLNRQNL